MICSMSFPRHSISLPRHSISFPPRHSISFPQNSISLPQRELYDLVRISARNGQRARILYNGGYQTVAALATAVSEDVEVLLKNSAPFQSKKKQGMETDWEVSERRKVHCIFLTGRQGVTEHEAAVIIIGEAKALIQDELGGLCIQWVRAEIAPVKAPVLTSPVPGSGQRNKGRLPRRIKSLTRKSTSPISRGSNSKPPIACVISPPPTKENSQKPVLVIEKTDTTANLDADSAVQHEVANEDEDDLKSDKKMFYLQELYQDAGIRVSGFMGHHSTAGGFSCVDVAVCTIEKGNSLVNRLLEVAGGC